MGLAETTVANGTTFEPHYAEVPPSAQAVAGIVGDAIRSLAMCFSVMRRYGTDTTLQGVSSRFTSKVSGCTHMFDIEVFAMSYGSVECRAGVTCDDFNLVIDDTESLARALADEFETSITVNITDGHLEFSIPMESILL